MKMNYLGIMTLAAMAFVAASLPARASETDDRIEASFRSSYVYKVFLKDDDVQIHSVDGVVTLTGDVADEIRKPLAEGIAEALPGVVRVDNQIAIQPDVPSAQSDRWVGMKVKTALVFHRSVNAGHTEVSVSEGVVTLKGEAASQAQKDLTAEYAGDVEGVKEVVNEMTVARAGEPAGPTIGEVMDDASITAQVRMALLTHRSTSVLSTRVSTKEGVVTVGGVAQSGAEMDLVTRLVKDIHGVKGVINQMTVGDVVTM